MRNRIENKNLFPLRIRMGLNKYIFSTLAFIINPNTMNYISKITLALSLCVGLFYSCTDKEKMGCVDSTAANYNPIATESSDDCCYECYAYYDYLNIVATLESEYCNAQKDSIENTSYSIYQHKHVNGAGQIVYPGAPGSIGVYDPATGNPVMTMYEYAIICGI